MDWLETHDKLSGWFQGIVAILAIVGVFIAAQMQTSAESKRHKDDLRHSARDKLLILAHLLAQVEASYIIALEEISTGNPNWKSLIEEIDQSREAVKVLLTQPFDLPRPELVWRLTLIQLHLRHTKVNLNQLATVNLLSLQNQPAALMALGERCKEVHALIDLCFSLAKEFSVGPEIDEVERQKGIQKNKESPTP